MYVQPPAAAATSTSANPLPAAPPEILTIEAPPPAPAPAPAPVAASASTVPPNQRVVRRQIRPRTDAHAPEEADEAETAPAAEAPQAPLLEPAASAVSEEAIAASQNSIQRHIDALGNSDSFAPADRQILQDARSFLTQSEQALKEHNLLKAEELAGKATLLLEALESKP